MDAISSSAIGGLGLALALGLLIGIERGWTLRNEEPGSRFAGVRTFGLLGLAGGISGVIEPQDSVVAVILLAAAAALILLGYVDIARRKGNVSGTASLVGLITLGCGYLAATHQSMIATIVAVVTTLILGLRRQLHDWIERLNEAEIGAITRFALISMAILPLLPDRTFGPLDAWNPRQLWMVVVLVSGFSFAGYIASKRLGASRGMIAMAAAGAIVSSTAVTAALANQMRKPDEDASMAMAGIAAASTIMTVRVLVLTGMLAPFALPALAVIVVPATLVSAVAMLWHLHSARRAPPSTTEIVSVRNPFDLAPALGLMALVMILSLVSRWVLQRFGDAGLATVLALSGMVDVDSAIITMGGLPADALDAKTAGMILALPVALNSLVKAGLTIGIAGWQRGWRPAAVLAASVVASLCALPLLI